ncbi:MAG: response regulator transcription factor [Gemmatimonadaceae bacterium]|nr:response regulator transcription factor [Gemmatimonadaceae bacterium]
MTQSVERHIVVADDEAHIGRIIKLKLEQGPFRVTLAFDGQEAVDVLQREDQVDLVVVDLMMPRMSGLDVLDWIRTSDRWRDLPCIVLTAAGEEQYEQDARDGGATDFLTKPFSPKRLYALIAHLTGVTNEDAVPDTTSPAE